MSRYDLFCDGSCLDHIGPGAWAFAMSENGSAPVYFGDNDGAFTNNQRVELLAVVEALRWANLNAKTGDTVTIWSDCQGVHAVFEHGATWRSRGWRRLNGKKIANPDLVKTALDLRGTIIGKKVSLEINWLKARSGHFVHNSVDAMARQLARSLTHPEWAVVVPFVPQVAGHLPSPMVVRATSDGKWQGQTGPKYDREHFAFFEALRDGVGLAHSLAAPAAN